MRLDRLSSHEQRLGDLRVRPPLRGERGDPPFGWRERIRIAVGAPWWPQAASRQFLDRAIGERRRSAGIGELVALLQGGTRLAARLSRRTWAPSSIRARLARAGRRIPRGSRPPPQRGLSLVPASDQRTGAQCDPQPTRSATTRRVCATASSASSTASSLRSSEELASAASERHGAQNHLAARGNRAPSRQARRSPPGPRKGGLGQGTALRVHASRARLGRARTERWRDRNSQVPRRPPGGDPTRSAHRPAPRPRTGE